MFLRYLVWFNTFMLLVAIIYRDEENFEVSVMTSDAAMSIYFSRKGENEEGGVEMLFYDIPVSDEEFYDSVLDFAEEVLREGMLLGVHESDI
ncbi:MAG: hypothetical protein DRJ47_06675 [Thermoprotei archaeon]|nr:MAG: hypothetical protein DRJ47_06675 [Thermoprotei archaeon]